MSERDPLAAYFEATEAPAADPVFRADVMQAIARRRLRMEFAFRGVALAVALLGFWLLLPVFDYLTGALRGELSDAVTVVAIAGLLGLAGTHIIKHGLPMLRLRFF